MGPRKLQSEGFFPPSYGVVYSEGQWFHYLGSFLINSFNPSSLSSQKSTSCVDDYGGPEALSELETQHIVNYFRENAPILGSIDFHSYGQLLLRPYGHTNATSPDEEFHKTLGAEMKDIIKEVSHVMVM